MNADYWTNMIHIPKHVAMICDGNGRWAKKRRLPRSAGHRAGVNTVKEMTIECKKAGVEYLSLYGFSTENWKRPIKEVNYLMHLFVSFLLEWRQEAMENNIRFHHIGDLNGLPESLVKEINETNFSNTFSSII
ncbi:polyprenyl diphosphate synthase [Oceanobacillus sp. CFH 90083]|uniref:polyprenyl diphosphate synthase n=1 Tax=Oceanobacillus sp. CFH 90083 TaxID=2592336 RepID=UPI00128B2838|nr:polyprenyl diphosphate synthase [Oceanobacillus sp. CFH 90083]